MCFLKEDPQLYFLGVLEHLEQSHENTALSFSISFQVRAKSLPHSKLHRH